MSMKNTCDREGMKYDLYFPTSLSSPSDPCASFVSSGRVLFSYDEVFFVVPTTGDVRCVLARDAVCSTFLLTVSHRT
jgi:hypothetical protein